MVDHFTQQLRASIVAAQEAARQLGHDRIDSCDLVLGLMAAGGGGAKVLADLGVTSAAVREHSARRRPAGPVSTGHIPFTADAKQGLEQALREAQALGHGGILTTGHLLLGVLAGEDGANPAAAVLAALDVDFAVVRAGVGVQHDAGVEKALARPTIDSVDADPPARLPGRGSLIGGILARLAWYAATVAALLALSWDAARPGALAVFVFGFPLLMFGLGILASGGRPLRRLLASAPRQATPPPGLLELLRGRGVTSLDIRIQAGTRIRDRCYRVGRRAWIVMSPMTLQREADRRFIIGHETAHILRNDSLRFRLDIALYGGLALGPILTFDLRAVAVVSASGLLHRVITRWWAELACDAVAVRWFGPEDLRGWAANRRQLLRTAANRAPRRRLRRLLGVFTHPPLVLRVRCASRR